MHIRNKAIQCIYWPTVKRKKVLVAKAIYYCRSIKQDILNIMMQGGPSKVFSAKTDWKCAMQARMKDKFLQIFGTSWIMPSDMMLDYVYGDEKNVSLCFFE